MSTLFKFFSHKSKTPKIQNALLLHLTMVDVQVFVIFSICISQLYAQTPPITFVINTDKPGPTLVDEFLSITIDAGLAGKWDKFDFSSPLVNTLAKGLSPCIFRYGGTAEDETVYDTTGKITMSHSLSESTLNMTEFSTLADFAQKNGWEFIFGLNAQERYKNNTWNPSNSRQLMMKIMESGRDNLIIGYELGNEPCLYHEHDGFMNVSAEQDAKDFQTLYNLINNDVYKDADYVPFIWGPDVTRAGMTSGYLEQFLNHSNPKQLAGATWYDVEGDT